MTSHLVLRLLQRSQVKCFPVLSSSQSTHLILDEEHAHFVTTLADQINQAGNTQPSADVDDVPYPATEDDAWGSTGSTYANDTESDSDVSDSAQSAGAWNAEVEKIVTDYETRAEKEARGVREEERGVQLHRKSCFVVSQLTYSLNATASFFGSGEG